MKHINDTSDLCPECTGSGMSGEACHLCWGSGKHSGNSNMEKKEKLIFVKYKPAKHISWSWVIVVVAIANAISLLLIYIVL